MITFVLVKNCINKKCNGNYKLLKKDFYKKDKTHYLYKWKGVWRLGNHGVKVYYILSECKNKEWNLKELNFNTRKTLIKHSYIKNNNVKHHSINCLNDNFNKSNINEINIIEFLSNYKNKEIIYIPNPGNAGDSLIVYGTIQVFDKIKLNYKIGNINKKYYNKTLFYAGGGNLVGLYKNCYSFIKNNQKNNKIILLPHTVKSEDNLIKNLNNNIIIICREKISYNYVHKLIKNKNNVLLSKDMAFYITDFEKYQKIKGYGKCNCFRKDSERTTIKIPPNNVDLSLKLQERGNTSNINIAKKVSLSIFSYLSKYEIINTNRLHIAIAGSLLNKKVKLYPNNYYKNKAVYDYSIKNNFFNSKFISNANITSNYIMSKRKR